MDVFEWISEHFDPRPVATPEFVYDDMASQSGECLPILYRPFDPGDPIHWGDRGSILDFLHASGGEGGRLLDFGPGDGWPSLPVAPFAEEVVGVDASRRRVEVCEANARRLGIRNARFVHVPPGGPLPFPDGSFDGVMAASSIEQSPDPRATIAEILRVLRPGGRLRVYYEALGRYLPDALRQASTLPIDEGTAALVLYDRDPERERVTQVRLTAAMAEDDLVERLGGVPIPVDDASRLEEVRGRLTDPRVCVTEHPSGRTLRGWLLEAGFAAVAATQSGGTFARSWFDRIPEAERPTGLEGIDRLLAPAVAAVVDLPAPLETDPRLTATK